jgi:hypothetical protein
MSSMSVISIVVDHQRPMYTIADAPIRIVEEGRRPARGR